MFAAAIFDMDGLLLDSERSIMQAWLGVAQQMGRTLCEAQYLPVIGRSAPTSDAILSEHLGGQAFFEHARSQVAAQLQSLGDLAFPLKPGARELLEQLRQMGIPCAVASSTEIAEVRRRLHAVGIADFFSAMAGGDEVAAGKPNPDVYLLAVQRLGFAPAQCLAFEDSQNGMLAALAAGIEVVVVPDLVCPMADRAFAVLSSLAQACENAKPWFTPDIQSAANSPKANTGYTNT